jgi:hypothetical protein
MHSTPRTYVTCATRQCLTQGTCIRLATPSILLGPLDSISTSVPAVASIDSVDPEVVRYCVHVVIVQTMDIKTHPFRSSPLSLFARDRDPPKRQHNGHPEIASTSAKGNGVLREHQNLGR